MWAFWLQWVSLREICRGDRHATAAVQSTGANSALAESRAPFPTPNAAPQASMERLLAVLVLAGVLVAAGASLRSYALECDGMLWVQVRALAASGTQPHQDRDSTHPHALG